MVMAIWGQYSLFFALGREVFDIKLNDFDHVLKRAHIKLYHNTLHFEEMFPPIAFCRKDQH